jgi:hypothetical protein
MESLTSAGRCSPTGRRGTHAPTPPTDLERSGALEDSRRREAPPRRGGGGAEAGLEERGGGSVRRSGMDASSGGAGRSLEGREERGNGAVRSDVEAPSGAGPSLLGWGQVMCLVVFSQFLVLVINELKFSYFLVSFSVTIFDNLVKFWLEKPNMALN